MFEALREAGFTGDWTMGAYREEAIRQIRDQVGDRSVLLLASGGLAGQEARLTVSPPDPPHRDDIDRGGAFLAPDEEAAPGPAPGAPTVNLDRAVQLALERNFALLDSADAVTTSRWQ